MWMYENKIIDSDDIENIVYYDVYDILDNLKWVEYNPVAVKSMTDEDGLSVLIRDANDVLPSMWIDIWTDGDSLESDFNQFIFDVHNWLDMQCWKIQHDSDSIVAIIECAEDYAFDNGLIQFNDDGIIIVKECD